MSKAIVTYAKTWIYPGSCAKKDSNAIALLAPILLLLCSISLNAQVSDPITLSQTFTDPRDNQSYRIKTFEKDLGLGITVTQTWMIDNLNFEMPNSWCFENDQKNCQQYGRLYTWEAAQNACPAGWHLPAEVEWQRLTHQFIEGGMSLDSEKEEAYKILTLEGSSDFDALLGGSRGTGGSFLGLGAGGSYWSATARDGDFAYVFYFYGGDESLNRYDYGQGVGLSVRCLQN